MKRYDVIRIASLFVVALFAFPLFLGGLYEVLTLPVVLLGGLFLPFLGWTIAYVVTGEAPRETHEACDPESCIHALFENIDAEYEGRRRRDNPYGGRALSPDDRAGAWLPA